MQTILWSIDQALSEVGRALFFLTVPPWLPFVVVWIRDNERHLVMWTATLGALGALLAHAVVPGIYFWADQLEGIGLTGSPAALASGLLYGGSIGLCMSAFIGLLRWLGRERIYR